MPEYPLIQTVGEVEKVAKKLARDRTIAVDTEADSFFHYYDKLCLLQIAGKAGIFLIDPLALPKDGLDSMKAIFADPNVRKVFHAADYDLYVLKHYGGIEVKNIFDTMVSAQLLGYPAVGLGALVERHFDVKLSKDQQRTDWSRRPLRSAQMEYAACDVMYLVELVTRLERELKSKKRLAWAHEEFITLENRTWPEREFDKEGHLRIKGSKKLSPRELAILRELYMVRDTRARKLDRPPFKVLGNGTLLELAQNPATSKRQLAGRKGVTDLVIKRLGNELLEGIQRGLEGPEHPKLERKATPSGRKRLDRRGEHVLERLKIWRGTRSKELELDPGVFCPNAILEQIAFGCPTTVDELRDLGAAKNWWVEAFGEEIVEALKEMIASAPVKGRNKNGGGEDGSGSGRRRRRNRGRRRSEESTEESS